MIFEHETDGPEVTVYSTSNCGQCKMTYRALEKAGIPYAVVDLGEDLDSLAMLRNEGYRQAPVVKVGASMWQGFRPDLIKEIVR